MSEFPLSKILIISTTNEDKSLLNNNNDNESIPNEYQQYLDLESQRLFQSETQTKGNEVSVSTPDPNSSLIKSQIDHTNAKVNL